MNLFTSVIDSSGFLLIFNIVSTWSWLYTVILIYFVLYSNTYIHTHRQLFLNSLVVISIVVYWLTFLYCTLHIVVPAREGCAAFHIVYMLVVTNYVWKLIREMEIDFFCLTSDSLTTLPFNIPYNCIWCLLYTYNTLISLMGKTQYTIIQK